MFKNINYVSTLNVIVPSHNTQGERERSSMFEVLTISGHQPTVSRSRRSGTNTMTHHRG